MSLTDTLGSLAVSTKGQYMTGVSVDIGTSFVKPAGKTGDILRARATLTGMGMSNDFSLSYHVNSFLLHRTEPCVHSHRFHE